jgi:uncharacterized membrane protein required for colicin V production
MPHLNYIDLIIFLVLAYFISEGLRHGFWVLLADFISFLASLILSLSTYKYLAIPLRNLAGLAYSFSNALGFLISAIVLEAAAGFVLGHLIGKIPEKYWKHKLNKIFGLIPAVGEAIVLISFFLVLALAFPIKPSIKNDIEESKVGRILLDKTTAVENSVNEVFGGVVEDSLTFLTIKPGNREVIALQVDKINLSVDGEAEREDWELINKERQVLGITPLTWSEDLAEVARTHARDMWNRKYFGHLSPQGKDIGDRLSFAKIKYSTAGENLALAPTVASAHKGLMNSEGHRENILSPRFKEVGIGAIDNGVYGKMFVQIFTD